MTMWLSGSWVSPVWEKDRILGHWLNFQFDPHREHDHRYPKERFKPLGSDK
jgi:hypothetical protein